MNRTLHESPAMYVLLSGMLVLMGGCTTVADWEPDVMGANYERVQVPDTNEPLAAARRAAADRNYAQAARYYEMSLARQGESGEALLGLAAAYDGLWRFDLSENAYRRAARLVGGSAEFLNNRGYSYLMQGRFEVAGRYLVQARELLPGDPVIEGNLRLLNRLAGDEVVRRPEAG